MREVVAAGALVWRMAGDDLEVVIVHRPSYDDWSIPKGKLKEGEPLHAAAVREVEEETGVPISLGQRLGTVRYKLSDGRKKVCYFWAGRPLAESSPVRQARPKVKRASKSEVDKVSWVEATAAYKKLTSKSDRELLGRLIDLHDDGKLDTTPHVVVRHGQAKKRSAHKGGENDRPLTKRGMIQADHLSDYLAAFGIVELHSSPWKRCADTLAPYARRIAQPVEFHDVLTEAAHHEHPDDVTNLLEFEISQTGHMAVCVHRPTLPTILDVLGRHAPYSVLETIPSEDPWLKTGELVVVHIAKPRGLRHIVALEQIRPTSLEK